MTIDTSVLDSYRDFMEEDADEFIRDVLNEFYTNAEELLVTLNTPPTQSSLEEFVRAAHTLKSTSATVGATQLSKTAAEIEAKGKAGEIAAMAPLVTTLRKTYEEAKAKLEEIYT
jgi:HPt (histidine-containing phosphotransfer) domain-containing protein